MSGINVTEMLVFLLLFAGVAVMGFMAARWKSGDTMDHLDEWGLGGRKFGGWITWFQVGGDLYTAYTFVAVPALMYASGRHRLLCAALHRRAVSHCLPSRVAALVGLPIPRVRHARRFRPRSLQLSDSRADRRHHRDRRHHAVHRAAVGRAGGGAADHGYQRIRGRRAPAAVPGVPGAGAAHLSIRPAGARADRVRQGWPDLHRDHRGGGLPAGEIRWLGVDLR